jgi:exopolysaccharide production protein ExoQ
MIRLGNQPRVELIVAFMAFFLASFPAFITTIWLIPQTVLTEAVLWAVLAVFSLWMLIRRNALALFLKSLGKSWFVLPFLLFAGVSLSWSVMRDISFYRWLVLLFIVIVSGYIGLQCSLKECIRLLAIIGTLILLLSFLLIVFVPGIGVMNYHTIQDAWRGIFWHKNHMGLMVTFVNIMYLIQLLNSIFTRASSKYVYGLLYIFSLFFLYKTDSVAAYLTTLILHGILLIVWIWLRIRNKLRYKHYLVIVIVVLLALSILYINIDQFFGVFNRNSSLTGRIPMWTYLYKAFISKRPLQGYGFNAFWYDPALRVDVQKAVGYPDPIVIADNGFIDIWVNTGLVGLVLFLILYAGVWWRSIGILRSVNTIFGLFPLIFMAFTLVANISWSLLFENESFFMLGMISILFCLTKMGIRSDIKPL